MIATYQEHTIEAIREGENWTTTIDGQASGVKASKSKIWAIKWAMQAIDEQKQTQKIAVLKDVGL